MNRFFVTVLAVAAVLYFPGRAAFAEQAPARNGEATVVYGADQAPTGDELRMILFGDPNGVALSTRGVVMIEAGPTSAPAAAPAQPALQATQQVAEQVAGSPYAQQVAATQAPSVAFTIEFAFDSAEVPQQYLPHLAAMAEALKSNDARGARTTIVGHTDARGTETYNESLSRRRAEATRKVLIDRYGVDAARLVARGVGEAEPLIGVTGEAAQNRRVEFKVN